MKGSKVIALLLVPMPQFLKKWAYRSLFGWSIDDSARIGWSFIHVKQAYLGPGSRIGNFNVIRYLHVLELKEGAKIGSWNYINAIPFDSPMRMRQLEGRDPRLTIGRHAGITGRHFLDCNDAITLGDFTTIAGKSTYFYTHGIDIKTSRQSLGKITIGKYCMVGARCMIVKGASLPDYSVLGAQSMLHKAMAEPYGLYSGNPAKLVKHLDHEAAYYDRESSYID